MRDAVLRRERVGAGAIAGRDRADRRLADVARGLDHGRRRDAGRAEDSDPDRSSIRPQHSYELAARGRRLRARDRTV